MKKKWKCREVGIGVNPVISFWKDSCIISQSPGYPYGKRPHYYSRSFIDIWRKSHIGNQKTKFNQTVFTVFAPIEAHPLIDTHPIFLL